jgi:hypothetical protein
MAFDAQGAIAGLALVDFLMEMVRIGIISIGPVTLQTKLIARLV